MAYKGKHYKTLYARNLPLTVVSWGLFVKNVVVINGCNAVS